MQVLRGDFRSVVPDLNRLLLVPYGDRDRGSFILHL